MKIKQALSVYLGFLLLNGCDEQTWKAEIQQSKTLQEHSRALAKKHIAYAFGEKTGNDDLPCNAEDHKGEQNPDILFQNLREGCQDLTCLSDLAKVEEKATAALHLSNAAYHIDKSTSIPFAEIFKSSGPPSQRASQSLNKYGIELAHDVISSLYSGQHYFSSHNSQAKLACLLAQQAMDFGAFDPLNLNATSEEGRFWQKIHHNCLDLNTSATTQLYRNWENRRNAFPLGYAVPREIDIAAIGRNPPAPTQ